MSFLTGKESRNKAFKQFRRDLSPLMMQQAERGKAFQDQGARFLDAYGGALGLGDEEAFNTGLSRFRQSIGYNTMLDDSMRGIAGSAAARGVLGSGAALRAMQDRASQLANQTFSNYLAQVLAGSQTGFNAAQGAFGASQGYGGLIAQTGQRGGRGGALGSLGQALGGVAAVAPLFSDRRLKDDIRYLGTRPDGLGVYEYTLKTDGKRYVGVMADDVARLRPDALGEPVAGFATVHYDRL